MTDDLVKLAWEYRTVFGQVQPGSVVGHSHTIDLNTTKDVRAKPYPLRGEAQIEAARTQIKALVDAGMVRPVTYSNFAAPVVVVNKKSSDGKPKYRLCVDYRLLNNATIPDRYPMPLMEKRLEIGKAKIFTKIDLSSAFWQVPVDPNHQFRTAFAFECLSLLLGCDAHGAQ